VRTPRFHPPPHRAHSVLPSPRARAPAPPRWYAHPHNHPRYYRLGLLVAPGLPRPLRVRLARLVGRVAGAWFPAERAAVERNLRRVHPGRDVAWRAATVRRVFQNFAVCLADRLSFNRGPHRRLERHVRGLDGDEVTREVLARDRGCVCVTAHLGNWELAGRLLAPLGRPVHVVMAPERDPRVSALLAAPESPGVRLVRRDSPLVSVGLVAALRRGEVVAFQMDRATGERADRRVPFFGTPAPFPLGPFLLAAAAGAPIVPAFCVLDAARRYRLTVEAPIAVARGQELEGLEQAVALLERYVGRHSDQWFNFYDVWDGAADG
jgi:lauroyl/myristoyl acyltransferase